MTANHPPMVHDDAPPPVATACPVCAAVWPPTPGGPLDGPGVFYVTVQVLHEPALPPAVAARLKRDLTAKLTPVADAWLHRLEAGATDQIPDRGRHWASAGARILAGGARSAALACLALLCGATLLAAAPLVAPARWLAHRCWRTAIARALIASLESFADLRAPARLLVL